MQKRNFKFVITASLISIIGISSFLPAQPVVAQSIPGVSTTVPVSDNSVLHAINGTSHDPISQVTKTGIELAKEGLKQGCTEVLTKITSTGITSYVQSLGSTSFSIIGGSDAEAVLNSAEAKALTFAYECTNDYVKALEKARADNVKDSQDLAREQQTYSSIRDTLSKKVDDLNARASASWKDVLKAAMVKIVLNLNKNLTTSLVNKMLDKYKISDYLSYGDALASQVYSMKYINQNFSGDAKQQMMIRSLLQSEKIPSKVQTAQAIATAQSQQYLGKACNVSANSAQSQDLSSYISCLSAWGRSEVGDQSPQYLIEVGHDQAMAAKQAGQANAGAEIANSNGFAPPRNCSGSVAMQNKIDSQVDEAMKDLQIKQLALKTLENSLATAKKGSEDALYAEIAKAQAAVDQATANYQSLFDQLQNSGGKLDADGKATGGAIIDICESIASPASFVSSSIGDFLKQHLDQTSNLKSDNLPFYATFLSDVATNFLTNILTGGKSSAQVLKESGTAALNSALGGLTAALPQNGGAGGSGGTGTPLPPLANSVKVTAALASAPNTAVTILEPGKEYILFLDLTALKEPPFSIEVTGSNGFATVRRNLNSNEIAARKVQINFTATGATSITANVYKTPDNGTSLLLIDYGTAAFAAPAVKGASIILPRGPVATIR